MNINILHMIDGLEDAKGIAVIIDVFRAFSVEAYIVNNNVQTLIAVGDKQIAYDYKEKNKDCILVGERGGRILPGFDFGNSPYEIKNVDFSGKTVIHTTSSGTQGIVKVQNVDEILTGSLVNAKAIAEYIKNKNPKEVTLICTGTKAQNEDEVCAKYIKSLLDGSYIDIKEEIEKLKSTSGAKFFDESVQDVFNKEDFYLCTEVNKFNFVLKANKREDGLNYIKKIDC